MYDLPQTPVDPAILSPPDGVPEVIPTRTRLQHLPFEKLSWENFERLCHRQMASEGNVERCARYGRQGDAQEGIDIFARLSDGRYHCLQAKRHRSFGASKLREAVDLFLAGSWAGRAAKFTIAVQAPLRSTSVQNVIESQAKRLSALGITFSALDGEDLTDVLRDHALLIDDFFGRPWVEALLGSDIAKGLGARLDGDAFAKVRAQLASVYEAQFQFIDPGSFGSMGDDHSQAALTLFERFLKPDMLVREVSQPEERADLAPPASNHDRPIGGPSTLITTPDTTQPSSAIANSRMRRVPLVEWLRDGDRIVVLGDAGCGKSTLLRVIALDVLHGCRHFPEVAERWGQRIPIYIPFARWVAEVARDGNQIGIKEIVRRSLQQLLTGSIVDLVDRSIDDGRILLIVDGLDEWSNEQAARTTLAGLVTMAEAHGIPTIVSGRPRGLNRISPLPTNWKRGVVAPLSRSQQATIASRWFQRYGTTEPVSSLLSSNALRTDRFLAELARDAGLGALAAIPLLLIGLVTLALRGQILPRTKVEIYDQLVRVLLEIHPNNRATASGDTQPRFQFATDPDQRRAAIARLAFSVRQDAGDAGMPIAVARNVMRTFLASEQGFALSEAAAGAAANEILSVNAETQGLIVEKAPDEVGFAHASFEEFLCAEHIGGWPFRDIEDFVRNQSGNARWRNVIVNLLSRIQRRDEFDLLVTVIEELEPDELVRFHKNGILGEIGFGSTTRSPVTARRLAFAALDRVETEDWLPARRDALSSVLKGMADPALSVEVERRMKGWLPAAATYRSGLVAELADWAPSNALHDVLWRCMHDEDRGVQRTAAATYARVFAPHVEKGERLLRGLASSRELTAAASMLECLALGWGTWPQVKNVMESATRSASPELRLVGIMGLAEQGRAPAEAKVEVVRSQNFWSELSYPHRELAASMLMKYWPGDNKLIEGALKRAAGDYDSPWELDVASAYLLESPTDRQDVCEWIRTELEDEFPFNTHRDERTWWQIGRFAKADPEIRRAANAYWCEPKNHIIKLHSIPSYVAQVSDQSVADAMIKVLLRESASFEQHWAAKALIEGWGRSHSLVQPVVEAVASWEDDRLVELIAVLPLLLPDKAMARERLLRLSVREDVRRDMLAVGLAACGCDHADDEAVAAILLRPVRGRRAFDPADTLFRKFGKHPRVRALALERVRQSDGSLSAIAEGYQNDVELEPLLFAAAAPLPVELRTQIVEVASSGAAGTALEGVLGQCMLESDAELRIRMVIAHHRNLPGPLIDDCKKSLVAQTVAVGPNYDLDRAAALAGLIAIGEVRELAMQFEGDKPVALYTGGLVDGIKALERLICERFSDMRAVFGDGLEERFRSVGERGTLAKILCTAPGASPEARAEFLGLAQRGELPRSPTALRALAAEWPRSELLLERCFDALENGEGNNQHAMKNAEIALILRAEFPGRDIVLERLIALFRGKPFMHNAAALAVYAPDTRELPLVVDPDGLGRDFGDWIVAVHVAAHRADTNTFFSLLERMVTRRWRSQFDAQHVINLAIEQRLHRDSELEELLSAKLFPGVNTSLSGSFARYLAAAGKLGPLASARVGDLLRTLTRDQDLPVAGYDALADSWRATRATLLDASAAGIDIN